MNPAGIRHDGPEIDLGGRRVAVLNAIVHSRRDRANRARLILDFLAWRSVGQQ